MPRDRGSGPATSRAGSGMRLRREDEIERATLAGEVLGELRTSARNGDASRCPAGSGRRGAGPDWKSIAGARRRRPPPAAARPATRSRRSASSLSCRARGAAGDAAAAPQRWNTVWPPPGPPGLRPRRERARAAGPFRTHPGGLPQDEVGRRNASGSPNAPRRRTAPIPRPCPAARRGRRRPRPRRPQVEPPLGDRARERVDRPGTGGGEPEPARDRLPPPRRAKGTGA